MNVLSLNMAKNNNHHLHSVKKKYDCGAGWKRFVYFILCVKILSSTQCQKFIACNCLFFFCNLMNWHHEYVHEVISCVFMCYASLILLY